jgi:sphinganine-1-phosphate aldolase
MDALYVIGEPLVSVVAFEAKSPVNVFSIAEVMSKKGWNLNKLQRPNAVHIAVTMLTNADTFLDDLKEAVTTVKSDPEKYKGGDAAIYGLAASIPDRSIVEDIAKGFLDALYVV